ncbi:MAG: hypothetical protein KH372_08645 [Olsenella uli]|uniref:hypothetical protein n=1 Tax=Olsenella uli TaxID=133926 RepID=UPI001D80A7A6|nr:hypothetical protein [Olsenella uli]MBS6418870.1 hypothetical protein [Olsenella uli]
MFSSVECMVSWATATIGVRCGTQVPRGASGVAEGGTFLVVTRTGGELDYPHDAPRLAVQTWARSEADAEALANQVAIALRTMPPTDAHVNHVGVPSVLSYGRQDGGWYVWQVDVGLGVNLLD